jgi:uncharacterized alkaline shock family protein YloU
MSEPVAGRLITAGVIARIIARTARETPGVIRLEPTLKNTLRSLGGATVDSLHPGEKTSGDPHPDGISVIIRDGIVDADIDIATDMTRPALDVAHTLQTAVHEGISRTGLTAGNINVTILAIEPATAPRPQAQTGT